MLIQQVSYYDVAAVTGCFAEADAFVQCFADEGTCQTGDGYIAPGCGAEQSAFVACVNDAVQSGTPAGTPSSIHPAVASFCATKEACEQEGLVAQYYCELLQDRNVDVAAIYGCESQEVALVECFESEGECSGVWINSSTCAGPKSAVDACIAAASAKR